MKTLIKTYFKYSSYLFLGIITAAIIDDIRHTPTIKHETI